MDLADFASHYHPLLLYPGFFFFCPPPSLSFFSGVMEQPWQQPIYIYKKKCWHQSAGDFRIGKYVSLEGGREKSSGWIGEEREGLCILLTHAHKLSRTPPGEERYWFRSPDNSFYVNSSICSAWFGFSALIKTSALGSGLCMSWNVVGFFFQQRPVINPIFVL